MQSRLWRFLSQIQSVRYLIITWRAMSYGGGPLLNMDSCHGNIPDLRYSHLFLYLSLPIFSDSSTISSSSSFSSSFLSLLLFFPFFSILLVFFSSLRLLFFSSFPSPCSCLLSPCFLHLSSSLFFSSSDFSSFSTSPFRFRFNSLLLFSFFFSFSSCRLAFSK